MRGIKPELFTHEGLFDLERRSGLPVRLGFAGLFTQCDREGRFEWRPRRLKAAILPYDDVDFGALLNALRADGYVVKYLATGACLPRVDDACGTREPRVDDACGTEFYGYIPTWKKHQFVNNRESASVLPVPTVEGIDQANNQLDLNIFDASGTRRDASGTREAREGHAPIPIPIPIPSGSINSKYEPKDSSKVKDSAEQSQTPAPSGSSSSSRILVSIPLNDKTEYDVTLIDIQGWQELYPNVNVLQTLRKMRGWSQSNPQKRKTRRGVKAFINRWLSEEQDRNPQRQGQDDGRTNKTNGSGSSSGERRFEEIVRNTIRACGVAPSGVSNHDTEDARAGNRVVEGKS